MQIHSMKMVSLASTSSKHYSRINNVFINNILNSDSNAGMAGHPNDDTTSAIKQNMKMLLLTRKGDMCSTQNLESDWLVFCLRMMQQSQFQLKARYVAKLQPIALFQLMELTFKLIQIIKY